MSIEIPGRSTSFVLVFIFFKISIDVSTLLMLLLEFGVTTAIKEDTCCVIYDV